MTVDGEDKIQVNGSSKFKVHVNGKPNIGQPWVVISKTLGKPVSGL